MTTAADVAPDSLDAPEPVTLHGDDVLRARSSVRRALSEIATKYRRERRRGNTEFAQAKLDKFDNYLDLYERLGGDPDTVPDPEDQPSEQGAAR